MNDLEVFALVALLIITAFYLANRYNKEGKLKDDSVKIDTVLHELTKFEMNAIPDRKHGFTEKDVQVALQKFFSKHFVTFYREYALEGINVKQIDFDLGKGRVGIEVKLAREIIKEGSWDRALGQINKYAKKKYVNGNLIVLVAGNEEERESFKLREFERDVKDAGAVYSYLLIKNNEVQA